MVESELLLQQSLRHCMGHVRCSEFGGCPLLGISISMGVAIGASGVVRYKVARCPLSVIGFHCIQNSMLFTIATHSANNDPVTSWDYDIAIATARLMYLA